MDTPKDLIEMFLPLAEAQMHPEKDEEIRRHISEVLRYESVGNSVRRRSRGWLGSVAAVCAACAVVSLALFGILTGSHYSALGIQSSSTTGTTVPITATNPAEVVTNDWRLVVIKSLLKPGSYYDFQLFYIGPHSISRNVTVKWGASESSGGGGTSIQPGSLVTGEEMAYLPYGLTNTSSVKVTWFDQDGKQHAETLKLSNAKHDLHVENHHEYNGQDGKWNVSYAYETIVSKQFHHSFGVLVLDSNSGPLSGTVHFKVQSRTGTKHLSFSGFSGDAIRIDVNPTQKGFNITQPTAKVTIQSRGRTDTLTLKEK